MNSGTVNEAANDDQDTLWRDVYCVAFSPDGLANGDLKIRLGDYQAVAARIGEVQPDLAEQINRFAPLLLALDIEPDDGQDTVTLPLNIRNGKAAIGILPLGDIPPIPPID